jgi:hypothetical protein
MNKYNQHAEETYVDQGKYGQCNTREDEISVEWLILSYRLQKKHRLTYENMDSASPTKMK